MEPSLDPGTFPAMLRGCRGAKHPGDPPEKEQNQSPPCQSHGAAKGVLGPELLWSRSEMLCASCKSLSRWQWWLHMALGAGALPQR